MRRVLVVDDDEDMRDLITLVLRRAGHDVVSIGEPLVALAAATDGDFDLAVLDWSMPVMHGGELCARMRELPHHERTPVLVLTAHADTATRNAAFEAGADEFMTKPFTLRELTETVGVLLDRER